MNFIGCIPRFLKAHAGWVLTALGSAGMIGTVILVGKEAPKAERKMEIAADNKRSEWMENMVYPDMNLEPEEYDAQLSENLRNAGECPELTALEKVKIAAPIYLPAILMGAGTLACFWGSQIFNVKKQAALTAAYGALVMQFDQYREAIKAEYGEEADKKALEVSRMEVNRLRAELKKLNEECGPQLYEFASLPGVIFENRPAQITNAIMHYNRNLMLRGWNDLQELYHFVGIPESCYDKKEASEYGWQLDENEVTWGVTYVDFYFQKVKSKFGKEVNVIYNYVPPFEVNVDYGFEGDSTTREYDKYNVDMAKTFAETLGSDEIIRIDPNWECYTPNFC